MDEIKNKFTDDQKAVVNREINSAHGALKTLNDWVQTDKLTEDMKDQLPKLIGSYLDTVKNMIGCTGEETTREKEMTKQIIKYYQDQIDELEKALEGKQEFSSLKPTINLLFKKLDKWWDIEGFKLMRGREITTQAEVKVELGFIMERFTTRYSDTPIKDQEELDKKVKRLEDRGFEFADGKLVTAKRLLDTEKNRELVEELIHTAFPSASIHFKDRVRENTFDRGYTALHAVDVTIYDVEEIERLNV